MRVLLTAFLFAAIFFPLVECCWNKNILDTNYERKCEKWWRHMLRNYESNWNIRRCVRLIQSKCPDFLVIVKKTKVKQRVRKFSTYWTISNRAELAQERYSWIKYTTTKITGVCKGDDQGLGDCGFWWSAAVKLKKIGHVVKRCLKLITYNCPSDLKKISWNRVELENGFFGKITKVKETYKFANYQPVTFNRYEY